MFDKVSPGAGVSIHPWLSHADPTSLEAGLDRVFFASSATTSFASENARAAFRERWLGRYLAHFPTQAFVASTGNCDVVGYIVGSLYDPARLPLFADIGYFQDFAATTPHYPAQLHVNLLPEWRGHGIGARLLETFVEDAARAKAPGVHVVTTRGMRNVRYYAANGFAEVASTFWNGRELIMLGRKLGAA
ncbi:MAG: GNAT family N-acetyltransferase [Hyphomicrobium sp.]